MIVSFLAGRIEWELDVAPQLINAGSGDLRAVFRFGRKMSAPRFYIAAILQVPVR
jgi:hypothetical protein